MKEKKRKIHLKLLRYFQRTYPILEEIFSLLKCEGKTISNCIFAVRVTGRAYIVRTNVLYRR